MSKRQLILTQAAPSSVLAQVRLLVVSLLICVWLSSSLANCQEPNDSKMSYLSNRHVKLGVDLNRGGAIAYFANKSGENIVNNFDRGRQIQMSFFSGPVPFSSGNKSPAKHWRHLGWNPIQAGDDFGNRPRILKHTNGGKSIYTMVEPLQWPLDNVPGDCHFEMWIELKDAVAKVRARLTNRRLDKRRFSARLQELPALYGNAKYHKVVSYMGDRPFTDGELSEAPKPTGSHPWSFWQGTECWSAVVDDRGHGLGLITPERTHFTGGFAGRPGPNKTHENSCSYLAGQGQEILDHNITYAFRFELVAGTIAQIRSRAQAISKKSLPSWDFDSDRQGWHLINALDQGWPIRESLRLKLDQSDPQMISPYTFWRAENAPLLEIQFALKSGEKNATVYWQSHGSRTFEPDNFIQFPVENDGQMRRYRINLANSKRYKGGIIRLRFDPSGGNKNESAIIKSIKLVGKHQD